MSFLQNILTAEWILNTAVHSLTVMIIGWILLQVFKRKNPPLRSGIGFTTMLALLLLLLISFSSTSLEHTKFSLGFIPSSEMAQGISSSIETETIFNYPSSPIKPGFLNALMGSGPFVIRVINLFGFIWVIGATLFLFRFLYTAASVQRLKKSRLEICDQRTKHIFSESERAFIKPVRARIFESTEIKVPMVIGFFKPYILIPHLLFKRLRESEIRGVFLHELSHIYHRDHMIAVLQRLITILNWWNPLVHAMSADLSRAREEISDNHVLLKNDSKEYAECLVNLAERNALLSRLPVSVAMASSHIPLKERVKHILSKERKMETQLKRSTVWMIILIAFLCLGLVSGYRLTFATNQESEQSESVSAEKTIPPDMFQEKKEQEKKEKPPVRAEGDVKPPKLIKKVDPVYPEEARKEGIEGVVILEATTDSYGRVLRVKILRPVAELNQAAVDAVKQWIYEPMVIGGEPVGVIFTVTCRFKLNGKDEPVRAVGEIKPPKLIKKIEPIYPEKARKEGIEGVVIIEVTTDEFGEVKDTKMLRSIPELDQAAIDAVEQWVYEPMIIEGKPKSIAFTVTCRFKLKDKEKKVVEKPDVEREILVRKVEKDETAVRIEGDLEPPKLIKKVDPIYPEEARKEGIKGKVLLEVTTDIYGRVVKIKILKSISGLDQAAVDAVKQWIYEPFIIKGKPKGAIFTVTIQFHLS